VYQIDIKFDRQLRPATVTSWMVSYGGKTILRWRTAAILKIDISPYLSEKYFDEILYAAADFELDERHLIKNKKSCIGQTPSSTERISRLQRKSCRTPENSLTQFVCKKSGF